MRYKSITHGELQEVDMFQLIAEDIRKNKGYDFLITIGTDSQTYSKTNVVTVVALHKVGHGGKFFYSMEKVNRIDNIRVKVYNETFRSIELAKRFTEFAYKLNLDINIIIHVDIGKSRRGKTHDLISEIMGWVQSEGFEAHHKPDSYVASTIADRLSK